MAEYKQVSISDEAFREIQTLAIAHRYSFATAPEEMSRSRGVGELIAAVFEKNGPDQWVDMRPDYLRSQDEEQIYSYPDFLGATTEEREEMEAYPRHTIRQWFDRYSPDLKRRLLKLTDSTFAQIMRVGIYHEITSSRPQVAARPSRTLRVSLTLEAWGLKHLRPLEIPSSNKRNRHRPLVDQLPYIY